MQRMKWGDSLIPLAQRPPVPVYISPAIDTAINNTIEFWRAGVTRVFVNATPWGGMVVGLGLVLLSLWCDWRLARVQAALVIPSRASEQDREEYLDQQQPLEDEPTNANGPMGAAAAGASHTSRDDSQKQAKDVINSVVPSPSTRGGSAAPKLPSEPTLGLKPKSVAFGALPTSSPAAAPVATGSDGDDGEAKQ
jgi:hypothetical protein